MILLFQSFPIPLLISFLNLVYIDPDQVKDPFDNMKRISNRLGFGEKTLCVIDVWIIHITDDEKHLIPFFLWNTAEIVAGHFFSAAGKNINDIAGHPVHDDKRIFEFGRDVEIDFID